MRSFFYYLTAAFILLLIETTIFSFFFKSFFGTIGLESFAYACVNTSLILCVYVALSRNFDLAVLLAFCIGYMKDMFVLTNSWTDPFLFVVCAVVTNVMKKVILLKGTFSFMAYTFFVSIFYSILWMIVTYNIFDNHNVFWIGLYSMFQAAFLNGLFSSVFYPAFVWFDSLAEPEEIEANGFIKRGW